MWERYRGAFALPRKTTLPIPFLGTNQLAAADGEIRESWVIISAAKPWVTLRATVFLQKKPYRQVPGNHPSSPLPATCTPRRTLGCWCWNGTFLKKKTTLTVLIPTLLHTPPPAHSLCCVDRVTIKSPPGRCGKAQLSPKLMKSCPRHPNSLFLCKWLSWKPRQKQATLPLWFLP